MARVRRKTKRGPRKDSVSGRMESSLRPNAAERRNAWLYIKEAVCDRDKAVLVEHKDTWRSEEKQKWR